MVCLGMQLGLTMDKDVKEPIKDYPKSVINRKTKVKGHLVNLIKPHELLLCLKLIYSKSSSGLTGGSELR